MQRRNHKSCGCISVTSERQDGAAVISAKYLVLAEHQELSLLLTVRTEALAAKLTAMGVIIGHIKAAIDIHTVEMLSLTDTAVQCREGLTPEIAVTISAVLFAVEETEAECMIKDMLEDIDRKLKFETVHTVTKDWRK